MNNSKAVVSQLNKNLGSAALIALEIGSDVNLALSPKSTESVAVFRIIERNGKPNEKHPVIEHILVQASLYNHHVKVGGNKLELL